MSGRAESMALALERMIAPVTGVPARPFTEETDSKLDISVVFTSVDATLAALKEAGDSGRAVWAGASR